MQQTRQIILEYLKEHGQATVDELADVLKLTSVTVRHHLDILRSEELIASPAIRRRATPGRPQYLYSLTEKASAHFPSNYGELASKILDTVEALSGQTAVPELLASVGQRFALDAPAISPEEPMETRLEQTTQFLNERGYAAHWERDDKTFLLHTGNCPYQALLGSHPAICNMDLALISHLLNTTPQCVSRILEGTAACVYTFAA